MTAPVTLSPDPVSWKTRTTRATVRAVSPPAGDGLRREQAPVTAVGQDSPQPWTPAGGHRPIAPAPGTRAVTQGPALATLPAAGQGHQRGAGAGQPSAAG